MDKKQEIKDIAKYKHSDIKDLIEIGESFWQPIHQEAEADKKFAFGYGDDQWDDAVLAQRRSSGRVAETYNIVPGFLRPLINNAKENPPAINCYPISGTQANKQSAMKIAGIIRAIEYKNKASLTYTQALADAARGGIGAWRIIVKEIEPYLDDLDGDIDYEFSIEQIYDICNLMIDPSARKPDFSDAEWFILKSKISEKSYRKEYPEGRAKGFDNQVEISELWIKEKSRIVQYVFDEHEILTTETRYPGHLLPICIVTGEQYIVKDKMHFGSLTKDIKPCCKELNWLKSEAITSIASAPKSSFIADDDAINEEQLEGWQTTAHNPDIVLFKKTGSSVIPIEPPAPPVGYMQMADKNIEMARIITGIYPTPDQQNSGTLNTISGVAIKNQNEVQATNTYHFIDSLKHAVMRCGEILIDLLPYYWNDNKVRMSLGVDGSFAPVSMGDQQVENADNFDLAYGKFGITISSGPSYNSQKEALINSIFDLVSKNPSMMGLLGDWLISAINLPGSEDLSERFAVMLPPQVQELIAAKQGASGDPTDQLKAVLLKLQQTMQENKQVHGMLDQTTKALEHETQQLQSKSMEADKKTAADMQMMQMKHEHEAEMTKMKMQYEMLIHKLDEDREDKKLMLDFIRQQKDHANALERKEQDTAHHVEKHVAETLIVPKVHIQPKI